MSDPSEHVSPFPALTPGQRLFFEVNGYVVVENTLAKNEIRRLRTALTELKEHFSGAPPEHRISGCFASCREPHYLALEHLIECHPAFFEYLTHPRLISLVEEVVGGKVRLDESAAIINQKDPAEDPTTTFRFNFHRGAQPGFDSYIYDELYHCTFVKTLTNLTDLGPDDGGTTIIAGSHKLNCDADDMVAAAYEKPELVHQVEAPAGSTMLMCETLIHATGHNKSGKERVVIIGGYAHPKHQAMDYREPSPELLETLSEDLHKLVAGHPYWTWPERHRTLGMDAHQPDIPYAARMWSVANDT